MFKAKDYSAVFSQIVDHPRIFPEKAWKVLKDLNLLQASLPEKFSIKNTNTNKTQSILNLLYELGQADLSVARIFEGHLNALLLIETYGTLAQKETYFYEAAAGKIFGVWNTERAWEGLKLQDNREILRLKGAKTFCTGALNIQRPIVTVKTKKGVQMIVLDLDNKQDLIEDWSLWNPTGMRASVSCRIDFTEFTVLKDQFLGEKDDYFKEPYFTWGAVRFSTIQLGGAKAIADAMLFHLKKCERTQDPYQKMRLGRIAVLLETAKLWVKRATKIDSYSKEKYPTKKKVNFAYMMRSLSLDICEEVIKLAENSVGIQGMMEGHPMEKSVRDLRVYLKQAGPDFALASIGDFVATNKSKKCLSKIT